MAGVWDYSNKQIADLNGKPLVGARATFYLAATDTPLITYQDYNLGTVHPFVVQTNGFGFFPTVFFNENDGFYKLRVTDNAGALLFAQDGLPIIGPRGDSESTPVAPVDPTAVYQTGDWKGRYGTGPIAGWVRLNGRTIGSVSSGATERANADTESLYQYLWNTDTNLPIIGGRGTTATSDWSNNKPITLPDWRGRVPVGLDDMGNTAAGRLTLSSFSVGSPIILGSSTGSEKHALTSAENGPHVHAATVSTDGAHTHQLPRATGTGGGTAANNGTEDTSPYVTSSAGAHTHTVTIASSGGGQPHNNLQPLTLTTFYIKL